MAIDPEVRTLFLQELAARKVTVDEVLDDGRYVLKLNNFVCTISLDNLSRDFAEDRDPQRIERSVETTLTALAPLPAWPEAQAGLRFSAEPADCKFGDAMHVPVTDTLCRVLV